MVDIDENELKKPTLKIDYSIIGDLKYFIPNLLAELNNRIDLPKWTVWTPCSVSCGSGTKSRKLIKQGTLGIVHKWHDNLM
jgi:hypothetical protein